MFAKVFILRNGKQLVDCRKLRSSLSTGIVDSPELERRVADDFIFLSLFNGNDYVPGVMFFDLTKSWSTYRQIKKERPNTRSEFIYDAKQKKVNWKLLSEVLQSTSLKGDESDERLDIVSPRHFVNQSKSFFFSSFFIFLSLSHYISFVVLVWGNDSAVYELVRKEEIREKFGCKADEVLVRLSSSHGHSKWEEYAVGKSQILACLQCATNAMHYESTFSKYFLEGESFQKNMGKIAVFAEESLGNLDELKRFLKTKKVKFPENFKAVSLDTGDQKKSVRKITKELVEANPTSSELLYQKFLEGIVWSFETYGGFVKNNAFHFPYRDKIFAPKLLELAPQVPLKSEINTSVPPLSPLALGMCLLADKSRSLLPEPFGSVSVESDPRLAEVFKYSSEALLSNPELLNEYITAVEQYTHSFENDETLNEDAKHLLKLHNPTAFMDRSNPLLKSFKSEEVAEVVIEPPKLPVIGMSFKTLKDAPFSNRTVAAINLSKPIGRGHWFNMSPMMQTRSYQTFNFNSSFGRCLFRK